MNPDYPDYVPPSSPNPFLGNQPPGGYRDPSRTYYSNERSREDPTIQQQRGLEGGYVQPNHPDYKPPGYNPFLGQVSGPRRERPPMPEGRDLGPPPFSSPPPQPDHPDYKPPGYNRFLENQGTRGAQVSRSRGEGGFPSPPLQPDRPDYTPHGTNPFLEKPMQAPLPSRNPESFQGMELTSDYDDYSNAGGSFFEGSSARRRREEEEASRNLNPPSQQGVPPPPLRQQQDSRPPPPSSRPPTAHNDRGRPGQSAPSVRPDYDDYSPPGGTFFDGSSARRGWEWERQKRQGRSVRYSQSEGGAGGNKYRTLYEDMNDRKSLSAGAFINSSGSDGYRTQPYSDSQSRGWMASPQDAYRPSSQQPDTTLTRGAQGGSSVNADERDSYIVKDKSTGRKYRTLNDD